LKAKTRRLTPSITNMSCSMMITESPGISSRTIWRSFISSAVSSGLMPEPVRAAAKEVEHA